MSSNRRRRRSAPGGEIIGTLVALARWSAWAPIVDFERLNGDNKQQPTSYSRTIQQGRGWAATLDPESGQEDSGAVTRQSETAAAGRILGVGQRTITTTKEDSSYCFAGHNCTRQGCYAYTKDGRRCRHDHQQEAEAERPPWWTGPFQGPSCDIHT